MAIREHITDAGEYRRVSLFPVRRGAVGKRGKRNKPSSAAQARLNDINSARRLTDLLNLNFTPDDISLCLTYTDGTMPADGSAAARNVRNFLSRVKYLYCKLGGAAAEFKYVYVTEVSKKGRWHHHVVLSGAGLTRDNVEALWGRGRCNADKLQFDEAGLSALAHYIVKDPVTSRRWNCSKNLRKPAVRQNDYRIGAKVARYIADNPCDTDYIERLYPGWSVRVVDVCELSASCDDAGAFGVGGGAGGSSGSSGACGTVGGALPRGFGGWMFLTLEMYRTDNLYFRYVDLPDGGRRIEHGYPKGYNKI